MAHLGLCVAFQSEKVEKYIQTFFHWNSVAVLSL